MPVIPPTLRRLASAAGNPLANPVSGCEANDQRDYTGGHCNAPPLPSRLASRACIRRTFSRRTRSKWRGSQQRPSLPARALLPKPTIAPPQIEHACTGFIVRAPWYAHGQAQQRGGRTGLSNTRPALRSPPQVTASAIRSWPASDEHANLVFVALLHPQQPLASLAVDAMLGGVKHGKDRTTDRPIG